MGSAEDGQEGWKKRFADYFVVCGLGLDVQTLDNVRGFHGTSKGFEKVKYQPQLLDQCPQVDHSDFSPPPQLPLIVLPGGVEIYDKGATQNDEASHPRSYPVVLTGGEGDKVYVSVVAFRDPVDEDIAEAYSIPPNSYADKCICLVSHWPFFETFREALEEIHRMCFSASGCSKPLWETVATVVTAVPLPVPGRSQVLFAVENSLLCLQSPTPGGLPFAEVSFRPLVQCLDIDNVIRLFTAVLLEKRILLRASKFELLTVVAEAACHLTYPFQWMYPYIPVLPYGLLELFDIPGSYLFGLSTTIADADSLVQNLDGVIVVDLDNNRMTIPPPYQGDSTEEIPPIPEPELGQMRMALLQLIHPNLAALDKSRKGQGGYNPATHRFTKAWGKAHDDELRLIFLRFFASTLTGYRNYVDYASPDIFNKTAFLRKRSRSTGRPPNPMLSQMLSTQGWFNFLERGLGAATAGPNLVDRLIEATAQCQELALPTSDSAPEIITIADSADSKGKRMGRYTYDRFPSAELTAEQRARRKEQLKEVEEAVKRPLRTVSVSSKKLEDAVRASMKDKVTRGALDSLKSKEREREREAMVVDIKLKLYRLWNEFLDLPPEEEPLSSGQYGTIYAMIESDAEGIGGSGFVECVLEQMDKGWNCQLTVVHFGAVKELLRLVISRATGRNNLQTALQGLQVASRLHKRDPGHVCDFIERHIGHLPVWQDYRFWEMYFNALMEHHVLQEANHATLVVQLLSVLCHHMAELGLVDADAWALLEALANTNRIGVKHQVRLRGILSHLQQRLKYFGTVPGGHSRQDNASGLAPGSEGAANAGAGGADPGGQGKERGWMSSMFSKDSGGKGTLRGRGTVRGASGAGGGGGGGDHAMPQFAADQAADGAAPRVANAATMPARPQPGAGAGAGSRGPTGVRLLRGHKAAVTAIHAGTRSELGDLVSDGDDVGYFVSGSFDGKLMLWDPNARGNELRVSLEGHTGPVRCITSDRSRVISGGDDKRVLVFDKLSGKAMMELAGHEDSVGCVRMLSGMLRGSVLTAGWDGQVKLWDTRSDQIATTVVRWGSPVLCMDYLDHASLLAAAGTDGTCHVWDVRAGKERYKLVGHSNWIRTVRMVGDAVLTGSDDWTARVWTLNDGQCEAVLACHGGPITCVEYSPSNRGIITGSADCTVRLWDRGEGTLRCVETVGIHTAPIVTVRAGERWLAIASSDNSMSLFHRPVEALAGPPAGTAHQQSAHGGGLGRPAGRHSMADWQLLRTLTRAPDLVRHVACDVDRGRLCSGGRNGVLRLWDPPPPAHLGS